MKKSKYTPAQRLEAQLQRQQEIMIGRYYHALAKEEAARRRAQKEVK